MLIQDRPDMGGELNCAFGETVTERGQKTADRIFRVTALANQMLPRLEGQPITLRIRALDRNRAKETCPRNLRQKLGVIGIGLVVLQLHHRMGLSRIDQLHTKTARAQLPDQPVAQSPRLHHDPFRAKAMLLHHFEQRRWISSRLAARQNPAIVVLDA